MRNTFGGARLESAATPQAALRRRAAVAVMTITWCIVLAAVAALGPTWMYYFAVVSHLCALCAMTLIWQRQRQVFLRALELWTPELAWEAVQWRGRYRTPADILLARSTSRLGSQTQVVHAAQRLVELDLALRLALPVFPLAVLVAFRWVAS
jgi:hypothetical protein